ncbi:MAG: anion permease, partial [Rikenellaceae bacterium]|nr:anion permease [Rikenellaceae bacterium]
MSDKKFSVKYFVLLPLVIAVTLFLWLVPIDFFGVEGLNVVQQRMIAIFAFAALMWMFEIIPAWTTSVVIIVLMLLTISNKGFGLFINNVNDGSVFIDYTAVMAAFANPIIMLFLGGFVLAIAATKVGLDVQLAKILLKPFGTNPKTVMLGILCVVAMFSMFMSNTATAAMMLAFLTPVLKSLPADGKGRIGLALAIPVAANIGGIGTPIGTPPNAIALGYLND